MLLMPAARSQVPVVHEATWRLVAAVPVVAPSGAHFHPLDGSIWVGSRLTAATGGAILRIDANLTTAAIVGCDRPAGVVVDPIRGDVFYSEDYGGAIWRIAAGTHQAQVWVSGFHSGDDDPWGMAIAPANYTGNVLAPGQALVCDRGNLGPRQIWQWSPVTAENERLVKPDDASLVNPMDVAIGAASVWIVDNVPSPGRVFELLPGGALGPLLTPPTLPAVGGVAIDPLNQQLLLRSADQVWRFDPIGRTASLVLEVVGWHGGPADGIDVSPDGRRMLLSFTSAGQVMLFERSARYDVIGSGCPGTYGMPALVAGGRLPRLGSTFRVEVAPVPPQGLVFGVLGMQPANLLLDPVGMTGCRLLVSNEHVVSLATRTTPQTLAWSLAIPANPALEGVQFLQQALVADPGANAGGAVVSEVARGVASSF